MEFHDELLGLLQDVCLRHLGICTLRNQLQKCIHTILDVLPAFFLRVKVVDTAFFVLRHLFFGVFHASGYGQARHRWRRW